MKELLPEEYESMQGFVDVLPACAFSPVYPYSGFVFNINVSTRMHRDSKDKGMCLVIPFFSDSTIGGELCIVELGLVFQLRSFDAIFFRSGDLTHFNRHYVGERGSLVFHSDSAGDQWVRNRNGWDHNIYLSTYTSVYSDTQAASEEAAYVR